MNTPVKFELAKLLKEKGFPLKNTGYAYNKNGELVDPCFSIWECEAPTIAEIVMWLYEKHGIWISVDYDQEIQWYYNIVDISEEGGYLVDKFNSHIAAYLAAIDYTLNNLI